MVGPDGAIYIADWYDPRVGGHQTFDYRGLGNIYRIAPKGFKSLVPKIDLTQLSGMIEALKSPAVNVRHLGLQALVAQGEKAIPTVLPLLNDSNKYIQARAVWVLSQLGDKGISEVSKLLKSNDPEKRIVAFRALRRANHELLATADLLANDSSPAVRREVALAIRDVEFEKCKGIILKLAQNYDGTDRTYLEALGTACSNKEDQAFQFLTKELKQEDSQSWSDQFESIAWRLHAPSSYIALKDRALSTKVNLASRILATDALAFIYTNDSAQAMLEIAKTCPDDLYPTAHHWLNNRQKSYWKEFGIAKPFSQLNRPLKSVAQTASSFKLDDITLSAKALLGKEIFLGRGTCFACHKMGDKGREIGPDLSLIGAKFNSSIIKEAITNPSSAIVFGYEMTTIKTKNGQMVQGFLLADHDPVMIKDIGGNEHSFTAEDIILKETSQKSLMPSAQQLNLSESDLQALADFLGEVAEKANK
jgi:putative heme-binding domain-containing protein